MEVGVEEPQPEAPMEFSPTDIVELNKDFFQPSVKYSTFCSAVQKDMTLGHLSEVDIRHIELRFANVRDATLLLHKNPTRYKALQVTIDDYLSWIALRVTIGRGRNGFTAKLMRTTFAEQKSTMATMEANERRKEGGLRGTIHKYTGI